MVKKWHKIALLIILVVGVLVSVKSCVDKKTPDITLAYIGSDFVNYESFDENNRALCDACGDINNDGEVVVELMEISFNESLTESDKARSSQKLANAVGAGAARVYLIEEGYLINNASAGVFADISFLGDGFKNPQGEVVGISAEGNKKVESFGVNTQKLYLAVRIVSEMDAVTDKNINAKYESSINIAKYILN